MVKIIDEKIKQENKSSKELEKKRLRDEKAARRKLDKEEREKKRKLSKNINLDDIQMSDSEDDLPLSMLRKK